MCSSDLLGSFLFLFLLGDKDQETRKETLNYSIINNGKDEKKLYSGTLNGEKEMRNEKLTYIANLKCKPGSEFVLAREKIKV